MTEWSQPIVESIWRTKYRYKNESSRLVSFARVVQAVYAKDPSKEEQGRAHRAMYELRWCPAGRIQAGAGTGHKITMMNCYVAPTIQDSMETEEGPRYFDLHGSEHPRSPNQAGILDALKTAAITQQMGGGIGMDFSTLRPEGAVVKRTGTTASGPLPFMDMWDAMCRTVMSAGHRRGAMMATMRCDHPDIERFITAKQAVGRLTNFNVSVLVTDAFMNAVKNDMIWPLYHEAKYPPNISDGAVIDGKMQYIYKKLPARQLWDLILRSTYDHAEPGVIFIDRVNALNNLRYCETIAATNPCGEQPLPPNGACNLGAVNLAVHVKAPFTDQARVDWEALRDTVEVGVRFLDNVLDVTRHPTLEQAKEARIKRRIGLGVTGLANMLQQTRRRYGSPEAVHATDRVMNFIAYHAYQISLMLGQERGAFPLFDREKLQKSELIQRLSWNSNSILARLKDDCARLRNGVLLTIAPTGTTSLYYDNVSSGIEPVFAHAYTRNVRQPDDTYKSQMVYDWGWIAYCRHHGFDPDAPTMTMTDRPPYMVTTNDLTVEEHLQMQAACQRWVDASISKTINCPADMPFEAFRHVYERAYELGLKGCTTYRPNPASGRGAILETMEGAPTKAFVPGPTVAALGGAEATRGLVERLVQGSKHENVLNSAFNKETKQSEGDGAGLWAGPHPGSLETADIDLPEPAKRPRPDLLRGYTKKIRWPSLDHAHYVTVNFDEEQQPFEVFITSKDADHQEWMQALSLLLTSILRKGGDVTYWADELAQVHSAAGGHILNKRFVPSLVAFIAQTVHELMGLGGETAPAEEVRSMEFRHGKDDWDAPAKPDPRTPPPRVLFGSFNCPKCRAGALVRREGCDSCDNCDYSKCG